MLKRRIFRKILFGPAKKITGTLVNIIAFDIAMTVYKRARATFTKPKPEEDEDILRSRTRRRW